jgi:hypothetical protein
MVWNRLLSMVAIVPLLGGCEGPQVWDYKIVSPKETDLVGTYKATRFYRDVDAITDFSRKDPIQIVLNPDHTTQVMGFPEFDALADVVLCKITESGTWKLGRGPEPQVHFHLQSVPKVEANHSLFGHQCTADFDLSILGHFTPYRLYWSFGGPDVDRGIEFERASR